MSTSIRESILENIKTTLEAVTSVKSVQRFKQRGPDMAETPCAIICAGSETKEDRPNPLKTCILNVFVELYTRQDDDDTVNSDTYLNGPLLDIEKALMTDITRGGYAVNTHIRQIELFETVEGEPCYGAYIAVEITYQHNISDPSQYP